MMESADQRMIVPRGGREERWEAVCVCVCVCVYVISASFMRYHEVIKSLNCPQLSL